MDVLVKDGHLGHGKDPKDHVLTAADDVAVAIPRHPLGIKPAGNAYTATQNLKLAAGLFACLPDEVIIQILEELESNSLSKLGGTCKAFYAFTQLEDLWKTLFIESHQSPFTWRGTWRSTYLNIPATKLSKFSCKDFFSDVLYRPFFCAYTPLKPYTTSIPSLNAIARLSNLSSDEFSTQWTDKPFILTDPVQEWPVYRDWSTEGLLEKYGEVKFVAEAVDWPLKTYVEYMNDNSDESPLYLFDRCFVEKMRIKVGKNNDGQYWAPECFGEDLFAVLGDQRPDSRWLIVGPERSGSTFHKDPNATSAWNAVLKGSKYWIMFPSSASYPPPPGVFVSEDQSEVTSPLSIAEWLIGFHAEARNTHGCMEGICEAGEVLHVPSGWWHLVVNLSPSIAITQNFVPRAHLPNALAFLKEKSGQVSGFKHDIKDPYGLFIQRMEEQHTDILSEAILKIERKKEGRKRKWDEIVKSETEQGNNGTRGGEFSFGFGNMDEEDVP